ncbi:hypothetical protein ACMYSQ_001688 [Aspergillus niger]
MEAGLQHFASLDKSYLEDVSSGIHEFTKARSLPIDNLTLDAYIEQRSVGFGLSVMVPWLRAAHEIEISTEEEKSIMQIIKKGSSVSALTNDYYSFHKEYDDAIGTGQSPKPYNAISVLMCDYAYSEDEAFQILKREILAQEVQLMEMVSIWLSAEQRSEDLRNNSRILHDMSRFIEPYAGPPGESIALQPLEYAESVPGKKYWSEFLRAMNVWLRLPAQSIKYMDTIFAHLCASSVMLDDIQDGSDLRRGQPATHILYGESQTTNSALYGIVKALSLAASTDGKHSQILLGGDFVSESET